MNVHRSTRSMLELVRTTFAFEYKRVRMYVYPAGLGHGPNIDWEAD